MTEQSVRFAESVTDGHPDKVCDLIADAILDDVLANDPVGRVGCEVLIAKQLVVVAGEFSALHSPDIPALVRRTLREIGYTSAGRGFFADDCNVLVSTSTQSPNLAKAILPTCSSDGHETDEIANAICAGDQTVVTGYAEANDCGMIPAESFYAKRLAQRLDEVRRTGTIASLWPDGKTLVGLEYREDTPTRAHTIVLSAHHDPDLSFNVRELEAVVVRTVIPDHLIDADTYIVINPPTGVFHFGGPAADTGLTGRKTVADAYGPNVPHGGGAFSGKDPSKIDRAGAYAARFIAKRMVSLGASDRLLVQLVYVLGRPEPTAVIVNAFGSNKWPVTEIEKRIRTDFDLRPGALIARLDLLRPHYLRATRYRHFGLESDLPWERTDG